MRSVMAQGHHLTLYAYDTIEGVPGGVEIADATMILPRKAIIAHQSGSVALFSDHFRFELLRQNKGIWLDSDMYLFKPLELESGYLLGWGEPELLASAVLALPPDSPIIAQVLRLFATPYIPDWLRFPDRVRAILRRLRSGRVDLAHLPWGIAGPIALTALARRYDLIHLARPKEEFHPYEWRQADWIFDPAQRLEDFVQPGTKAMHLFNFLIADRKGAPAKPGSFMARLQEEGA